MSSSSTNPEPMAIDSKRKLPGAGLPVKWLPPSDERFPHGIADVCESGGVTVRERRMLDFINKITDKPEWDRKVFDEAIVETWRKEAVRHDEQAGDLYLSEKMFDYCIAELKEKSEFFKETGMVHVLDAEVTVVKSDSAVPESLKKSLLDAVRPLEEIPDKYKDWHPGSDEMVLDLVHPSLFPLVYGISRVVTDEIVPLKDCFKYCGKGEIVKFEDEDRGHENYNSWSGSRSELRAWGSFQWLPSNIKFTEDGEARIDSYINNLHPKEHDKLYRVLEKFVDKAVPLWNESLSWNHDRIRITLTHTGSDDWLIPEGMKYQRPRADNEDSQEKESQEDEDPKGSDEESEIDEWDDDYIEWKESVRVLIHPEPPEYQPLAEKMEKSEAKKIDLRKDFSQGIQIIFKLANIHLSPEKPQYNGGSWHIEGALNEHICATALYYYDQENITDSHLAFRQALDVEEMTMKPEQSNYESLEQFYGVEQDGVAIQELGQISTCEGRLLTFPNTLQHRVSSFKLADETKPGHRKILAMFLVDPHIPILSTANVPPQRRDWWADEIRPIGPLAETPEELFNEIVQSVDGFPMSWEDALAHRENLMDERGAMIDDQEEAMKESTFFFCEH